MLDINVFNVYQINIYIYIYQNLTLPYKAHTGTAPSIFSSKFSKMHYNYSSNSKSNNNYIIPKLAMKLINFAISRRGPILWNAVLDTTLKELKSFPLFKAKVKETIPTHDNSFCYFNDFKLDVRLKYIRLYSYAIINLYYS